MTRLEATVNVAALMHDQARQRGDQVALVESRRGAYRTITFRELDEHSDRIAAALRAWGVPRGTRLALLVPPSIEFVTLVFALFKAGVVAILIDPGMGKQHLIDCLAAARPEGFVGIPRAQLARVLYRKRFPQARWNVTVGRRWFWGGRTLAELLHFPLPAGEGGRRPGEGSSECDSAPHLDDSSVHPSSVSLRSPPSPGGRSEFAQIALTQADDPAAIIFTTGSTGPPKGVLYHHGNFAEQVAEIRARYFIEPGGVDLACFPLFGLFNAALGLTTVIPDMDATRPARADPAKIVQAVRDWQVTQSFGSPAVWHRVGPYCQQQRIVLESLRHVYSAGAPIPPRVMQTMLACLPSDADMQTPYGATEALPVASISAHEVLGETRAKWAAGAGTCVGTRFPQIDWKVIRIVEGPIVSLAEIDELPRGEIGELIVRGAVVTREYVTRIESNALAKIAEGDQVWHRMGDVGYLDERERFWFCGRLAHRVTTSRGTLFTDPCEGVFNQHPRAARSALVGVGPAGSQTPVMVVEPLAEHWPQSGESERQWIAELRELGQRHDVTRDIDQFLFHRSFPVDIRHNAKIFREKLALWAANQLGRGNGSGIK